MPDPVAPVPAASRPRRLWWALGVLVALGLAGALALAGWLASDAALEWAVREVAARSGGRLQLEGARGSLLSTLQADRLVYRDGDFSVVADALALEWSPEALWSRRLRLRGLGAQTLTVTLAPGAGSATLPSTLALPFAVDIERAAIGTLVIVNGAARSTLRGVQFAYHGDDRAHRLEQVACALDAGEFAGWMRIGAAAPFPVGGAADFIGNDRWRYLRVGAAFGGPLDALDVALTATAGDARAHGHARLTPFAAIALPASTIDIENLDLARFAAGLPRTAIAGTVHAALRTDGALVGRVTARNDDAGAWDRARLPLTAIRAEFAATSAALELAALVAEAGPQARARGSARIPLADAAGLGAWQLELAAVDLSRLHSALIATRLAGRFDGEMGASGGRLAGELAQEKLRLAFAATVDGTAFDVARLQARSGVGEFTGRARYDSGGEARFAIEGRARQLDPAQFGRFPSARLDGELRIAGRLQPTWSAEGTIVLAATSRLRDAPLAGEARGRVSAQSVQDARIDLRIAGATLRAVGSVGGTADRVDLDFDIPDWARLAVSLADWLPASLSSAGGRLRGKASLAGTRADPSVDFEVHAQALQFEGIGVGALHTHGSLAAAAKGRTLSIDATATRLRTPVGDYASVAARLAGSPAAHTLTARVVGDDIDADLRFDGSLADGRWRGSLAALRNRGTYGVELAAPARLELGPGEVSLADARLAIADGNLRIGALRWADGRLDSEGAFDAVPLAALARMAGATMPLRSTLVLAGEWNVAASPRLNGTLTVRRQRGDLFATAADATPSGEIPFGLAQLDLRAKLVDDAVDATLAARAERFGVLSGQVALGRDPAIAPGRLGVGGALSGTLMANIGSLRPLQPFIGAAAQVDGRVEADLRLQGTPRAAIVTGTVTGTGLRLDAPQYGLHWGEGVVRARFGEGRLVLDEFAFRGGDGRFTANGVIAAASSDAAASSRIGGGTRIAWQAERLRATNRPDLRLVVSGQGQLAFADRHLAVSGALKVDEGRVDFDRTAATRLGDDVIVVGRPRPPPESAKRFGAIPFGVDLDVDLGPSLAVSGEGLEARAAGRVRVSAAPDSVLAAKGTIRAVNGSYFAFGQRLSIERGRLIFDGPIDNPALDVVALRKNLQVEAGVKVSGTVKVPRVELTSEPPVPDGEKLSWLVLGQGLDRATSGADTAALQAAAATVFGSGQMPIGTTLARSVGLDDIALRSGEGAADAGSQVIAVGKRLSDKLYIVYEQGLTVANNALKIEYALTRQITLRAEAGLVSGVGIYYRRSFE